MREALVLRLLYGTAFGRMILQPLVQPEISEIAGRCLSSRASRWLVPYYIRKHKIDMRDIDIPQGGFASFNEFFTRKRTTECFDMSEGHLISPCDGFLSFVKIGEDTVFDIKGAVFTLDDLLQNRELARQFKGGCAFIFRLTPADYHRYCYVESGEILFQRKIRGRLHCVRPIAVRTVPVFSQNSREYQVLKTEKFGTLIQMEIGALLVGKIRNNKLSSKPAYVQRGEEKGYFEFGGSTIVVLLKENAARQNEDLYRRQNDDGEIPVHMGEFVAMAGEEKQG